MRAGGRRDAVLDAMSRFVQCRVKVRVLQMRAALSRQVENLVNDGLRLPADVWARRFRAHSRRMMSGQADLAVSASRNTCVRSETRL